MKTVKSSRAGKMKIVQMNSKPNVANKTDRPSEKTSKRVSSDSPNPQITYDMIAQRAWSIWMSRGCKPGQDEMNWFQAELELRSAQNTKGAVCDTNKE